MTEITAQKACTKCGQTFTDTMNAAHRAHRITPDRFGSLPASCPVCTQVHQDRQGKPLALRRLGFPDMASIAEHFERERPKYGDMLIVAGFQPGSSSYVLVQVADVTPDGRILVSHLGADDAGYYFTGVAAESAPPHTTLLPYVDAVAKHLELGKLKSLTDEQLKQMLAPADGTC